MESGQTRHRRTRYILKTSGVEEERTLGYNKILDKHAPVCFSGLQAIEKITELEEKKNTILVKYGEVTSPEMASLTYVMEKERATHFS